MFVKGVQGDISHGQTTAIVISLDVWVPKAGSYWFMVSWCCIPINSIHIIVLPILVSYLFISILNFLTIIKFIFTFWTVSFVWLDLSRWNKRWNNNVCCLPYTANFMAADAQATLGASAAGMVLTPKPEYSASSIRRVLSYLTKWVQI